MNVITFHSKFEIDRAKTIFVDIPIINIFNKEILGYYIKFTDWFTCPQSFACGKIQI